VGYDFSEAEILRKAPVRVRARRGTHPLPISYPDHLGRRNVVLFLLSAVGMPGPCQRVPRTSRPSRSRALVRAPGRLVRRLGPRDVRPIVTLGFPISGKHLNVLDVKHCSNLLLVSAGQASFEAMPEAHTNGRQNRNSDQDADQANYNDNASCDILSVMSRYVDCGRGSNWAGPGWRGCPG
jgi:hypothetical protein